jgi:hypothetical protein
MAGIAILGLAAVAHAAHAAHATHATHAAHLDRSRTAGDQATSVALGDRVLTFAVSSEVEHRLDDGPYQGLCVATEITATGPVARVSKLITETRSDEAKRAARVRPFERPFAWALDQDRVVVAYLSTDNKDPESFGARDPYNPNRAQVYLSVYDRDCNELSPHPFRLSDRAAEDAGAPRVVVNGGGNLTLGYVAGGMAQVVGLRVGADHRVQTLFRERLLSSAASGRPALWPMGPRATLMLGASARRQDGFGTAIAWLSFDAGAGARPHTRWRELPSELRPANGPGAEPQVTGDASGHVYVQLVGSGAAEKSNLLVAYQPTEAGLGATVAQARGLGGAQTDGAICAGSWGATGEPAVALLQAASGDGPASMTWVRAERGGFKVLDSATVSSGSRGRSFLNCTGDVANPNYHRQGAWMSQAKTLFVAPSNGAHKPGKLKNALSLSFASGAVDPERVLPQGVARGCSFSGAPSPEGGLGFGLLIGLILVAVLRRSKISQ